MSVAHAGDVERRAVGARVWERDLGAAAGAVAVGLRLVDVGPGARACLPPERMSTPPHRHPHEHELFHVLEGAGAPPLFDNDANLVEQRLLRPGHLVPRPANSLVAHTLPAGGDGMTVLAYGTRRQDVIVFYPPSCKLWVDRDLQRLVPSEDYWKGEV